MPRDGRAAFTWGRARSHRPAGPRRPRETERRGAAAATVVRAALSAPLPRARPRTARERERRFDDRASSRALSQKLTPAHDRPATQNRDRLDRSSRRDATRCDAIDFRRIHAIVVVSAVVRVATTVSRSGGRPTRRRSRALARRSRRGAAVARRGRRRVRAARVPVPNRPSYYLVISRTISNCLVLSRTSRSHGLNVSSKSTS